MYLPSVDIEQGYAIKSGMGSAGIVVFVTEISWIVEV